jgi:hypothetical protein
VTSRTVYADVFLEGQMSLKGREWYTVSSRAAPHSTVVSETFNVVHRLRLKKLLNILEAKSSPETPFPTRVDGQRPNFQSGL